MLNILTSSLFIVSFAHVILKLLKVTKVREHLIYQKLHLSVLFRLVFWVELV